MNSIYIYHNLGMGDHIMCNAIVRINAEKYDKVFLFAKPRNVANVTHMFRDLKNLKVLGMDDADVKQFMRFTPANNYLVVGITPQWFYNFDVAKIYDTFDHGFYVAAGIDLEEKWNKFYYQRDLSVEFNAFQNKIGLTNDDEYFFVHDDPANGRAIRPEYIPEGMKVINPKDFKDVGLFEFLYTISHAKEIHVMNSSFMNLIDCIQLETGPLFLHQYTRTDMGDNPNPKLKLNWTIIK